MEPSSTDLNSLIAQTDALSWDDPSSLLATTNEENQPFDTLALVGLVVNPGNALPKQYSIASTKPGPLLLHLPWRLKPETNIFSPSQILSMSPKFSSKLPGMSMGPS
ncbi:hypothetical protein SLA2020_288800 [Shorea laevis]